MKKIFTILLLIPFFTNAQESADKVKMYLDCDWICDDNYLQEELSFVDFYKDPAFANVHVIVRSQQSGNGGSQVEFRFIGEQEFDAIDNNLHISLEPNVTDHDRRIAFKNTLQKGLYAYAIHTELDSNFTLEYKEVESKEEVEEEKDPWNSWAFRLSANGYMNGEEGYAYQNSSASFSANRITKENKFLSYLSRNNTLTKYDYEDYAFETERKSTYLSLTYVKSISDHFSLGARSKFNQSTYSNLDASYTLTPGVEYNFFPYSESSEHRFSVFYGVSANFNDYTEQTIYLKDEEFFPAHSMLLKFTDVQTWGDVSLGINGMQILDREDMQKYNLGLWSEVSWKVFKGLSLRMFCSLDFDRAQIELPAGETSYEDIILRQKELESSYFYYTSLGISYAFGSMKNNVVNVRF